MRQLSEQSRARDALQWLLLVMLPLSSRRRRVAKRAVSLTQSLVHRATYARDRARELGVVESLRRVAARVGRRARGPAVAPAPAEPLLGQKLVVPPTEQPLVSIVIPAFNEWRYTFNCIRAVCEHSGDVAYEIIVADDGSSDETTHIHDYVDNLVVVRGEANRGFLLNCNEASRHARGTYLLFLNNDTQVCANWLLPLVQTFLRHADVGLVGSKLIGADGRLQDAGGIIWRDGSARNYGRSRDPAAPEHTYVKEVDFVTGASFMIRRELWADIGGFDPRYAPAYYEDVDLAFEVRKRGRRVMYQPASTVIHFEGISHGTDVATGIKRHQVLNQSTFRAKWQDVLLREQLEPSESAFQARERGQLRRTLLVIDHVVPHHDRDAGSKNAFQYLKLFLEMGFTVKFLGDNFNRYDPYTAELEQLGVEVLHGPWYRANYKRWLARHHAAINYAYLIRPDTAIKYIDLLKKFPTIMTLYFGCDLHFLRERREAEVKQSAAHRHSSSAWQKIESYIVKNVDVSYFPSQIEVDELKRLLPAARVKRIPCYIYEPAAPRPARPADQREGLLFVGGFGHSPNVDGILWFVQEVFPLIRRALPGITLTIVGSKPPQRVADLASEDVTLLGFVSDEVLETLYERCRLVIAPLRFGAGIKGKVVEALYHGVGVVTTSVGAEGLGDVEGLVAIADGPEAFARETLSFYEDRERLERVAARSAAYITAHFSPQCAREALRGDLEP